MSKVAKYSNAVKNFSEEQVKKYSEEFIEILNGEILKESKHIKDYVENLRRLNPDTKNIDLAKKLYPDVL